MHNSKTPCRYVVCLYLHVLFTWDPSTSDTVTSGAGIYYIPYYTLQGPEVLYTVPLSWQVCSRRVPFKHDDNPKRSTNYVSGAQKHQASHQTNMEPVELSKFLVTPRRTRTLVPLRVSFRREGTVLCISARVDMRVLL